MHIFQNVVKLVVFLLQKSLTQGTLPHTLLCMTNKTRVFRRSILSTALIAGLIPTGISAMSLSEDPLQMFAQCAGRLEAETDFARLWNEQNYSRSKQRHAHFQDLISAVRTVKNGQKANRLQLQAKSAHLSLLWRAQFATTQTEAQIAQRSAARDVAFCLRMLPS